MGISNSFRTIGTALNSQSIHLEIIAKNMANSQVVAGSPEDAYRARRPVFAPLMEYGMEGEDIVGVTVDDIVESQAQIERQRVPEHPLADEDGYIYLSNVNMVEEMTNMIMASRSYQANIEVLNTSKELMLRTLSLGA